MKWRLTRKAPARTTTSSAMPMRASRARSRIVAAVGIPRSGFDGMTVAVRARARHGIVYLRGEYAICGTHCKMCWPQDATSDSSEQDRGREVSIRYSHSARRGAYICARNRPSGIAGGKRWSTAGPAAFRQAGCYPAAKIASRDVCRPPIVEKARCSRDMEKEANRTKLNSVSGIWPHSGGLRSAVRHHVKELLI